MGTKHIIEKLNESYNDLSKDLYGDKSSERMNEYKRKLDKYIQLALDIKEGKNDTITLNSAKKLVKDAYIYVKGYASFEPDEIDKRIAKDIPELFGNELKNQNLDEKIETIRDLLDEIEEATTISEIERICKLFRNEMDIKVALDEIASIEAEYSDIDIYDLDEDSEQYEEILNELKSCIISDFSGEEDNLNEAKKLTEAPEDEEIETSEEEVVEEPETELSEEDQKVQDVIDELKSKNNMYAWVIEDILDDSEDYSGDTLKDRVIARCNEIYEHGCVSGTVGSLIYYSDTTRFFNDNWDDIYDMLEELDDGGVEPMEAIKRHCSNTEILMGTDQVKNWIAWMCYE